MEGISKEGRKVGRKKLFFFFKEEKNLGGRKRGTNMYIMIE